MANRNGAWVQNITHFSTRVDDETTAIGGRGGREAPAASKLDLLSEIPRVILIVVGESGVQDPWTPGQLPFNSNYRHAAGFPI